MHWSSPNREAISRVLFALAQSEFTAWFIVQQHVILLYVNGLRRK